MSQIRPKIRPKLRLESARQLEALQQTPQPSADLAAQASAQLPPLLGTIGTIHSTVADQSWNYGNPSSQKQTVVPRQANAAESKLTVRAVPSSAAESESLSFNPTFPSKTATQLEVETRPRAKHRLQRVQGSIWAKAAVACLVVSVASWGTWSLVKRRQAAYNIVKTNNPQPESKHFVAGEVPKIIGVESSKQADLSSSENNKSKSSSISTSAKAALSKAALPGPARQELTRPAAPFKNEIKPAAQPIWQAGNGVRETITITGTTLDAKQLNQIPIPTMSAQHPARTRESEINSTSPQLAQAPTSLLPSQANGPPLASDKQSITIPLITTNPYVSLPAVASTTNPSVINLGQNSANQNIANNTPLNTPNRFSTSVIANQPNPLGNQVFPVYVPIQSTNGEANTAQLENRIAPSPLIR